MADTRRTRKAGKDSEQESSSAFCSNCGLASDCLIDSRCADCPPQLLQAAVAGTSSAASPVLQAAVAGSFSAASPVLQASLAGSLDSGAAAPAGVTASIDALATTLQTFMTRMERICTRKRPRKRPPSSSEASDADKPVSVEPESGELSDDSSSSVSDEEVLSASSAAQEKDLVSGIIKAVRDTLKISESAPPSGEPSRAFGTRKSKRSNPTFPYVPFFDDYVYKDWSKPVKAFSLTKRFNLRYPFEESLVKKWSSPPVVDPPVSRLNKSTVVPVEESPAFKDQADRKMESIARSMFTAAGALFRPILATTLLSQAVTDWSKELRSGLVDLKVPPEYPALVDQLVMALQFICDASLDSALLCSRLSAFSVVIRRILWLKCWSADQASKKLLTEMPFEGGRLFGATLDELIKNITGGKSTFLPQSRKPKEFRRKTGPSFSAHKRFFRGKGSFSKDKSSRPSTSAHTGRGDRRPWQFKGAKSAEKPAPT